MHINRSCNELYEDNAFEFNALSEFPCSYSEVLVVISEIVWNLHAVSFCLILGFCLLSHFFLVVLLVTLYFFFIPSLMTWNPVSVTLQTLLRNTDQIILL